MLKQGKNVRQTLLNMAMGGAIYNLSRIIKKCQHFGHFIGCLFGLIFFVSVGFTA